jgi:hypothetical protein
VGVDTWVRVRSRWEQVNHREHREHRGRKEKWGAGPLIRAPKAVVVVVVVVVILEGSDDSAVKIYFSVTSPVA